MRDAHRWHDQIVASIVGSYPSAVYIEIGVASCVCFNLAASYANVAHAVDPDKHAVLNAQSNAASLTRRWNMTSDRFFKAFDGQADVIFIDGRHTYAQARRDFENAAKILRPGGTIILHDVHPGSVADTREAACGDVYRLADAIVDQHDYDEPAPTWRTFLFGRFPGVLICQRPKDNPVWTP